MSHVLVVWILTRTPEMKLLASASLLGVLAGTASAQACGVKSVSLPVDQRKLAKLSSLKILTPQGITPKIMFEEVSPTAAFGVGLDADTYSGVVQLSARVDGGAGVSAELESVGDNSFKLTVNSFGDGAIS